MPTNRKKKKSSRNRSAAAVYCGMCQAKLVGSGKLRCVCTRVNFCNQGCLSTALQTGKHDCSGAPSAMNRMQQGNNGPSPLDDPTVRVDWQREYKETIQQHIQQIILLEGVRGNLPANIGPEFYARLADKERSGPCAYMAGILYKNRMLGNVVCDGRRALKSTGGESEGVLETDELAYKYLLQASEAGIGIAMQSLAELYIDGQGVRERRITGHDWLWHAHLLHSAGATVMLDSKALVPLEIDAMVDMLGRVRMQFVPGQSFSPSGPNLTSLLACWVDKLRQNGYELRSFAAAQPTLTVGNEPREGTTGAVPIIGAKSLEELYVSKEQLRRRGNPVTVVYGRRGVGKAATAQTHENAQARIPDSFLYKVPPEPQCNDQYGKDKVDAFCAVLGEMECVVDCVHSEGADHDIYHCPHCIKRAEDRLAAVSCGRVAISLHEILPARGRTALWRDEDGNLQSDTFKVYCRGEAEQTLAALVACEPRLAHPLFVAQDPNFLWPLIDYHGTVRAALEYVAPHVAWNRRLGDIDPPLDQQSIVKDAKPGKILARCGNTLCTNWSATERA